MSSPTQPMSNSETETPPQMNHLLKLWCFNKSKVNCPQVQATSMLSARCPSKFLTVTPLYQATDARGPLPSAQVVASLGSS